MRVSSKVKFGQVSLSLQAIVIGLAMLPTCAAQAQSVTKYKYDVHGQVVGVARGENVTTYTYDDAQNRVGVSSGMSMDPGPPPPGEPATIIVLPLPGSRLLHYIPEGAAMGARQLSAGVMDAEIQARATNLYGVDSSDVVVAESGNEPRQTANSVQAARIASLAATQPDLNMISVRGATLVASGGDSQLQSRAASLAQNPGSGSVDAGEPSPPAPFDVDVMSQRLSSLRGL